jgi:ATP-dependent Clp protease ATP-binding subunit ClpA
LEAQKLAVFKNNYKKINLEHPNKGRSDEDIAEVVAKWTGIPVIFRVKEKKL